MSEIKVNKISPRTACGTVTLGDSGDTFTIPSGATITNAGTASGFGATGETSWDTTVKTNGTFTATAGVGYFLNTTAGTITVNLAAGTAGDSVAMADYAATWQTNNVTVAANGTEKIGGVDADVTLSTEGQAVTFVYIDGTQGWVNVLDSTSNVRGITPFIHATGGTPCTGAICGDCKIHSFTGPGTFCVSSLSPSAPENVVSYMVVAGGGGGGDQRGGGGGAGGFREYESPVTPYVSSPLDGNPCGTAITVSALSYAITVGGGGSGATAPGSAAPNGNNSIFSTITSAGGGGGGSHPPACNVGAAGGSGGGLIARCHPGTAGGVGNTPPTTPPQGNPAGAGTGDSGYFYASSGGGATAAGSATSGTTAGTGGAGATTSISASPTAYAGGGGGGANTAPATQAGGAGGGGSGGFSTTASIAGGCNTGGGGGGGPGASPPQLCGAGGGSGIVIIRYKFQ